MKALIEPLSSEITLLKSRSPVAPHEDFRVSLRSAPGGNGQQLENPVVGFAKTAQGLRIEASWPSAIAWLARRPIQDRRRSDTHGLRSMRLSRKCRVPVHL